VQTKSGHSTSRERCRAEGHHPSINRNRGHDSVMARTETGAPPNDQLEHALGSGPASDRSAFRTDRGPPGRKQQGRDRAQTHTRDRAGLPNPNFSRLDTPAITTTPQPVATSAQPSAKPDHGPTNTTNVQASAQRRFENRSNDLTLWMMNLTGSLEPHKRILIKSQTDKFDCS